MMMTVKVSSALWEKRYPLTISDTGRSHQIEQRNSTCSEMPGQMMVTISHTIHTHTHTPNTAYKYHIDEVCVFESVFAWMVCI